MPPVGPGATATVIGPVTGLIVQVLLLGVLDATVGLGVAGWITGTAYGLALCGLLLRALRGFRFRPADWVTLTRATFVGCVAALTADSFTRATPVAVLVAIAIPALVLDAVDGQVARRTNTASAFGARFDMEVDSFLLIVLSVYVAPAMGAWVVAIGAIRYVKVVAGWVIPWLRGVVAPRYWRKVVAAIQGIVLVVAAADVLPHPVSVAALSLALALLCETYGRDVVWVWRQRGAWATGTGDHA